MRFTLYYLNNITGIHKKKLQNLLQIYPGKNFPKTKAILKCNKFQQGDINNNKSNVTKWGKNYENQLFQIFGI